MNLANALVIESRKLVNFGYPPIETNNVGNLLDGIVVTRIENYNSVWKRTDRSDRMADTNDVETISETTAYRNHIKDSEIETRNVFERETLNKNIENIVTRLGNIRLDNNKMT